MVSALVLLAALSAAGDTIVLKNGRRIIASNVKDDGEHITYETPAGTLSIPKSIVARIDRDNFAYSSAARASSEPPVTAPQIAPVRGYEEILALTIHDDSIDFAYISQLESDARSGAAIAVQKVAAAHYAAAQFLAAKGDIDSAIDHYRQALVFAPKDMGLLLNLAVLYLNQSQPTAALDPLERARRVDPDSFDVAKLMGWAYYQSNKPERAIAEWNRALKLRADPDIEHALEKVERDKAEEE